MRPIPKKRFGQNFLTDTHIIQSIIDHLPLQSKDYWVEIGPGLGALTKPLLTHLKKLTVIEIDRTLAEKLKNELGKTYPFTIENEDVLKVDFNRYPAPLKVIGNFPYNISTPLLFHLLSFPHITDIYGMLQKEVVDRLLAKPNTSEYGRLSIMVQYFAEVERLISVSSHAFYPPPKVESAFIHIRPRAPLYPIQDLHLFENVVRHAFQQRRKILKNTLSAFLTPEDFAKLDIDLKRRPESLSIEEYAKIVQYLEGSQWQHT